MLEKLAKLLENDIKPNTLLMLPILFISDLCIHLERKTKANLKNDNYVYIFMCYMTVSSSEKETTNNNNNNIYSGTVERTLYKIKERLFFYLLCSGVVDWLTRRISNLRIASRMGSNPVRDKLLFL